MIWGGEFCDPEYQKGVYYKILTGTRICKQGLSPGLTFSCFVFFSFLLTFPCACK